MNGNISIQVQSVLYNNEIESLRKAAINLDNAFRIAKKENTIISKIRLYWGDASPKPLYTNEEIKKINQLLNHIELKYEFFNENTGSAKGHNIMAMENEYSHIMIMNPDVIVSPRFFIEIIKPLSDSKVGMVEARQTPIEHQKEYDKYTGETDWATTACAIIPMKIFKELSGFDNETFFLYCDDLDFSWRLRLLGYKIIYQPYAPVFHAKRLSTKGKWQPTSAERYYSAEAAIMMAYKFSNNKRVEILVKQFLDSKDENQVKAANEFLKRKNENRLPMQIDKEHKVATFIGDYYSKNRFVL